MVETIKQIKPRRAYRHFWRCQFEKVLLVLLIGGCLAFGSRYPDHPWIEQVGVFVPQAFGILLYMLKGSWTDPKNGDGQKSPEDA